MGTEHKGRYIGGILFAMAVAAFLVVIVTFVCSCIGRRRESEKEPGHGYGMAAMGRIVEKYGSILKVDTGPKKFSVKTYLCMRRKTDQSR